MKNELENAVSLLSRTPAALEALLGGLPAAWTGRNEGGNTWTAFEVVGHLIHSERVAWLPRARVILESGEAREFAPLDRSPYNADIRSRSLAQLLEEFGRLRAENLAELGALNLRPEDLARRGSHPSLGAVTLGQLLATWAAHDLTHLHQLSRILAHQLRDSVGPFSRFLGVLQCTGHSTAA